MNNTDKFFWIAFACFIIYMIPRTISVYKNNPIYYSGIGGWIELLTPIIIIGGAALAGRGIYKLMENRAKKTQTAK